MNINALGQTWIRAISAEDVRWNQMADAAHEHGKESEPFRLARKRYLSALTNSMYSKVRFDAAQGVTTA